MLRAVVGNSPGFCLEVANYELDLYSLVALVDGFVAAEGGVFVKNTPSFFDARFVQRCGSFCKFGATHKRISDSPEGSPRPLASGNPPSRAYFSTDQSVSTEPTTVRVPSLARRRTINSPEAGKMSVRAVMLT